MSEDSQNADEGLKHAIEERVRERLPAIQKAIHTKTGQRLSEDVLAQVLAAPMADVATELTIQASYEVAGPMPSPRVMAGYVELYPGAAEQLFEQFRDEQRHRHQWENRAITETAGERRRRDRCAYAIAGAGLLSAAYIASLGAHTVAAVLVGAIVLGGGAIILGREFLASHSENGTEVSIRPDGSNSHRETGNQRASGKRRGNAGQKK